jgi:hypothetical protein
LEPWLDEYEKRERAYLAAVSGGANRDELGTLAAAASDAAGEWQSIGYRAFFDLRERLGPNSREVIEKEIEAEKAEMLSELWRDIATAHRGEPLLPPPE